MDPWIQTPDENTAQTQWHKRVIPARRWGLAELAAAVVAIACYVNVLRNEYTDDGVHIARHNPLVTQPGQWGEIWTTDYWADQRDRNPNRDLLFRPAAVSSYKIVRAIAGPNPWPQLLTNILLHALVSVLTVRLCRHLGGAEPAAWAAGLVFAVMPIHVEVIANVVGRADLLAAAGVLVAALAHRRSRLVSLLPPSTGAPIATQPAAAAPADAVGNGAALALKTRWRIVAALAAFVAMAAKESGAAVIPVVVLIDLAVQFRYRERLLQRRWLSPRTAGRLLFLIAPAAAYLALRFHALGGALHQNPAVSKTVNVLVDAPVWQHWMGVVQLWGMYWAKTIWPGVLSINYSINTIHLARRVSDPQFLFGALVTLSLIVWSVVAWRRGAWGVAMALAIVLACYAPTSNALVLIQVYFAERIWYLPSIGVAVLVGLGASRLIRRRSWAWIGVLLVAAMLVRCWVRNAEWHDNGTVYASAYRACPDAVGARLLYGTWLVNEGYYEEGVALMNKALDIDIGFTDAHRELGRAHLTAGRYDLALHHLQIANAQIPGDPGTVEGLGRARDMIYQQHRSEVEGMRRTADEHPDDVDAEVALLRVLRELDLMPEALDRLRRCEPSFGGQFDWELEYILALQYASMTDDAIRRSESLVVMYPNEVAPKALLGGMLMSRASEGDLDRAWRLIEDGTRIAPNQRDVLILRALLLGLRGELDASSVLLKRILAALPPDDPDRPMLEEKLRTLGE